MSSARVFLAALLAITTWAAHAETPSEKFLASLAAEVQRSRSAPPSEQEGPKGPTPELGLLVGLSSARLRAALGEPDSCSSREAGMCTGPGVWEYILDASPPGWLGGGGRVLVLEFGPGPSCTSAKWQFIR